MGRNRTTRCALWAIAPLVGLSACGGDDRRGPVDAAAGDGAAAVDAGTDAVCAVVPTIDGACTVGERCVLAGSPCGSTWTCPDGTWDEEVTCPPMQECPTSPPSDGEPCSLTNPPAGPLRCRYDDGCATGMMIVDAVCDDSSWTVTMEPCPGT
jgi:hypothetical protein